MMDAIIERQQRMERMGQEEDENSAAAVQPGAAEATPTRADAQQNVSGAM